MSEKKLLYTTKINSTTNSTSSKTNKNRNKNCIFKLSLA